MRALILDFDGLVLDTETADFEAWSRVYEDHGVTLDRAEWVPAIGTDGSAFDPMARLCELAAPADPDRVQVARRAHRDALLAELEPLPGVLAWLERARERDLICAIASSSPRVWVAPLLERVALGGHFHAMATAEQVRRVKPDPELYQRALALVGAGSHEAIALEDSPNGVAAAKCAGLTCVAVPGPMTRGLDFEAADLVLDSLVERSLDEVLELLC